MCYQDNTTIKLSSFYNGTWLPGDTLLAASHPLVAIGPGNTIYQEYATSQAYVVRKSIQSSWQILGSVQAIPFNLNVDTSGAVNLICYPHNTLTVVKYETGAFKPLEDAGLRQNNVFPAFALDSHGIAYMFGADSAWGNKGTLSKYDGTAWTNVGPPGFTDGPVSAGGIVFDKNDIAYVAYNTYMPGNITKVQKYAGGSWEYVGDTSQLSLLNPFSIRMDGQGGVYIGGYSLYIVKFDGVDWVPFSQVNLGNKGDDMVVSFSFDVSKNGIPYVFYAITNDLFGYLGARFRFFDGAVWKDISSTQVTSSALSGNVAVDTAGSPWIVLDEPYHLIVKKFEGNAWSTVGNPFPDAGGGSIAIDKSNNVFIGYNRGSVAAVKKYNTQNGWENLGEVSYSIPYSTAIWVSDNNPLLAIYNYDSYAWQYAGAPTSVSALSGTAEGGVNLYPNPVTDNVIVDLGETLSKSATLTIAGIDGKLVFSQELNQAMGSKVKISTATLSPGMYLVTIKGADFSSTNKLMKF